MQPDRIELVFSCVFCQRPLRPGEEVVNLSVREADDGYLNLECHLQCLQTGLRDEEREAFDVCVDELRRAARHKKPD